MLDDESLCELEYNLSYIFEKYLCWRTDILCPFSVEIKLCLLTLHNLGNVITLI